MNSPKICIVYNGGSGGDFLVSLLSQHKNFKLDTNGMVLNPPGRTFKDACEKFFLAKFKNFEQLNFDPIVNTHYCYKEIIDLFPECKFYFIDDSDYIDVTTEIYIHKRIISCKKTLFEWLLETNSFKHINKIKNLSDAHITIIIKNDYKKCLKEWKKLKLIRIDLHDLVNKEKCRNLVNSMLQSTVNNDHFDSIYDAWFNKNTKLISKII